MPIQIGTIFKKSNSINFGKAHFKVLTLFKVTLLIPTRGRFSDFYINDLRCYNVPPHAYQGCV